MTTRARVLIADDHELTRLALRNVLAGERDLEVVGEARTGREAVNLCRDLQPDLMLMDIRMPELDGLAATRAIKESCPRVSVLIVTMYEDPNYLLEALKAGAAGYLLKDATQREVVTAVRQVLRGESLLNPGLATQLLRRMVDEAKAPPQPVERLTPRELEVLELVARGLTNREIGRELVVSVGTVKLHVEHIIGKLGVSDRTQAAVRAVQMGLVTPAAE